MPKAFFIRFMLFAAAALGIAGCTVKGTETPDLAGPSEFALSFNVAATPDSISQDGGSQSSVVVSAFGPNGKPRAGVTFKLDMLIDGQPTDYGNLSGKTVVTGSDGKATAIYTAPPPIPVGTNLPTCTPSIFSQTLPGGCIVISATPVGSNFVTGVTQTVQIHLVPLGVILPPSSTPTASFTITPSSPAANTPTQFDASASCAGSTETGGGCAATNQTIASYAWEFSDGGTASGRVVSHTFASAQSYSVTLTVTNDRGVKASSTKQVTVGAGAAPTAAFVYSPTPVVVGAQLYFDASTSRPGLGHTIASYKWNWGDNDSAPASSSPLQDHDYLTAGTFTVVLTVTDDAGQIGTTTQTITVTAGAPVAEFSFVVENAVTHTIQFDGRTSSALGGSTITDYAWLFGDGSSGINATPSRSYAAAGTYTVKLTVTDSAGKVGVVSKSVVVP